MSQLVASASVNFRIRTSPVVSIGVRDMSSKRLAVVTTHPIQYQSPWFRAPFFSVATANRRHSKIR